jgi:hypothetical protein
MLHRPPRGVFEYFSQFEKLYLDMALDLIMTSTLCPEFPRKTKVIFILISP